MSNKPKNTALDVEILRHSASHVLAQAVLEMFPDAKLGIGPAIENGFYYDFDLSRSLTPKDLNEIEKRMRRIAKQNYKFKKAMVPRAQALRKLKGQPYKRELAKELADKKICFYRNIDAQGNMKFEDMCRGPHVESTRKIGAFKLTKLAGAYWRGNEKNKMLQRIYGVAFPSQKGLDEHLKMLEEAEKRDHRKLGKELDLFCFSDLVGAGLPMFTPKGTIVIDELQKNIEKICRGYGFEKVKTPHLSKIDLYELSGHAKKFSDELFRVTSSRKHDFVMKPVQCPHQTQIYASRKRSYRDLPIRYMESEKQYRAEKTGELGGLSRVYAITVEDGHSFCTVDGVKKEVKNMVNVIKDFYKSLGMWGNHWVSLSVRDYQHQEKYIGTGEDWDICEKMLEDVCEEMNLKAKRCEGEAALYGPKIDFMFKTALGNEIQIPTVQLDFATPKRFKLAYTDKNGKEIPPVMVHRAVLGSYERFLVLLIEHFAGAFPVWLSPVQVQVISVGTRHKKAVKELAEDLREAGIRAKEDNGDETVGNKIRKAVQQKVPYMVVMGDKEAKSRYLAVRVRGKKQMEKMTRKQFKERVVEEISKRK